MGPDAMILDFLIFSFKPAFSLKVMMHLSNMNFFFFFNLFYFTYLFIYVLLHWVFFAAHGLSLVVASFGEWGYSLVAVDSSALWVAGAGGLAGAWACRGQAVWPWQGT